MLYENCIDCCINNQWLWGQDFDAVTRNALKDIIKNKPPLHRKKKKLRREFKWLPNSDKKQAWYTDPKGKTHLLKLLPELEEYVTVNYNENTDKDKSKTDLFAIRKHEVPDWECVNWLAWMDKKDLDFMKYHLRKHHLELYHIRTKEYIVKEYGCLGTVACLICLYQYVLDFPTTKKAIMKLLKGC